MRRPLFLLFVSRWELIFSTEVEDVKGSFGCSPHLQTFPQASTLAVLASLRPSCFSIYSSPDLLWPSSG